MHITITLFDREGKPAGYFDVARIGDQSIGKLIVSMLFWVGIGKIEIVKNGGKS